RGAHGLLRVRGQERPRLPDVTPADVVAARARLDEARAALAAELGALDAEAAGVAGGLAALERCGEVLARLEPGEATAVAELEDTRLPGAQSKALSGPAADAFREALAGFARACLGHALLPTRRALPDLARD